jgi:hypothetical protein
MALGAVIVPPPLVDAPIATSGAAEEKAAIWTSK